MRFLQSAGDLVYVNAGTIHWVQVCCRVSLLCSCTVVCSRVCVSTGLTTPGVRHERVCVVERRAAHRAPVRDGVGAVAALHATADRVCRPSRQALSRACPARHCQGLRMSGVLLINISLSPRISFYIDG